MRVTTATEPGRPDYDNEDFVAASHNSIVLLDGAGTPVGSESGCRHGVAWYSRHLGTTLLNLATDQAALPLRDALAASIDQVASLHREECDLRHPGSPSATVIVARQGVDELDYLVLADSVLILQTHDQPIVVCDEREAEVGRHHRDAMDALPSGSPEHVDAHRAYVETLRSYRNQPGGFWVASSDPAAAQEAIVGTEPLAALTAVVLLSDGASRLVDRFALASWPELVQLAHLEGPSAIIDQVRKAERSDSAGQRWPRGKSSDDATAALIVCRDSVDA
jgi:hypothetical protein